MNSSGLQITLPFVILLGFYCSSILTVGGEVEDLSEVDKAHPTFMDEIFGFLSCLAAVVLYGSYIVPVKMVDTGDGMFFQWTSCASIWVMSFVGDILFCSTKAPPTAMIGGVIWATGNIGSVPMVKCIGLGLGMLFWASNVLLVGWASSRFGLFGLYPEDVPKPLLNYCGAGLCLLSAFILFFVKSDVQQPMSSETTPILIEERSLSDIPRPSDSWVDTFSQKTKRQLGCFIAVVSGLLFGCSFVPMLYIKHHTSNNSSVFTGSSQIDFDYCFAQSSGIFLTSTVYFFIYCVAMKNKPRIYPRAILPGFLAGLMWSIATYCWLLANYFLGPVLTFPIVTAGYGLVAALWGSVVFKEVKGFGNELLFALASCVVLAGALLTVFSAI